MDNPAYDPEANDGDTFPPDQKNNENDRENGNSSKDVYNRHLLSMWSGVAVFVIGLGIGIVIGYFALHQTNPTTVAEANKVKGNGQTTSTGTTEASSIPTSPTESDMDDDISFCPTDSNYMESKTSADKGIFELLTGEEMKKVREFMANKGLVTSVDGATPTLRQNYIYSMSLYLPPKADALAYLDKGQESVPSPGRFADVHVHRGANNPPDAMEYKVGPLDGEMTATALHDDGVLPYNSRPRDGIEWDGITTQVIKAMEKLRPILEESFDGAYYPDGGLTFHPQAPPGLGADERQTRFVMALLIDGTARGRDLHALPLTGTVSNPGTNTSAWYAHSFYYLNQGPYNTPEELLAAYNNGTIRKFAFPAGYRQATFDRTFPKQDEGATLRQFADKAAPRTYEPEGKRYSVKDHTVKWMDWEFTIGASQNRGPSVFNAMFKGERIVYENSLNDVILLYAADASAGADSNTIYLDATFGIGEFSSIIPGIDCPEHSTVLKATWWDSYSQTPVEAKAICVFEADGEEALWRRKDKFASGLRNHYLVVRIPMGVGNYDYTVDFAFFLDGRMKTNCMASGYLQASFWDPENPHAGTDKSNNPFGYRVADYTFGSIHDHSFGFKVDMDILGTENNFEMIHWKGGDVLTALNTQANVTEKPAYFLYNQTRYLQWETLQQESGLKIDLQNPKYWVVSNTDHKNKWGVSRGYRIVPVASGLQVVPDTHPALQAVKYSKYHCSVTKQKDSEKTITGSYDLNRLNEPLVSIENYLDGESVVKQDLVNWINIGFLHIPSSEDVPMTVRAESGFWLKPFNYFDRTATFDMPSYVDTKDGSIKSRPPKPKRACAEEMKDDCYFC